VLIKNGDNNNDNYLDALIPIVEAEADREPFSNLPPEQRRILLILSNSIKAGDQELAEGTMKELSDILLLRNEELESLRSSSEWSLPIGIIGLTLTVVFGSVSIYRQFLRGQSDAQQDK